MDKNNYRKFTLNYKEKEALDYVINAFRSVVGVMLFGSRTNRLIGNDIDVMIIISKDANKNELKKVREMIKKFKKQEIVFQLFLISLENAWYKIIKGDIQFVTILNNSFIYKSLGFLQIMQLSIDMGLIFPKIEQIPRLLEFSRSLAKKAPSDLRSIFTSVSSNIQGLLLLNGINPIMPPEEFPEYLRKTEIDPMHIDLFRDLQFFLKFPNKTGPTSEKLNEIRKKNLKFIDYVEKFKKTKSSIR